MLKIRLGLGREARMLVRKGTNDLSACIEAEYQMLTAALLVIGRCMRCKPAWYS